MNKLTYRKVISGALLLITGVIIGFFIGNYQIYNNEKAQHIEITKSENEQSTEPATEHHNFKPGSVNSINDTLHDIGVDTLAIDSTFNNNDTLSIAVSDSLYPGLDEPIRRDKLIHTKIVHVRGDNSAGHDNIDSALAELTGTTGLITKEPEEFILEFWRSPVNYQGYKIVSKRIILFGLNHNQHFHIERDSEKLILKAGETFYHLKASDDFSPYRVIR